jgi:hypothetical protein
VGDNAGRGINDTNRRVVGEATSAGGGLGNEQRAGRNPARIDRVDVATFLVDRIEDAIASARSMSSSCGVAGPPLGGVALVRLS